MATLQRVASRWQIVALAVNDVVGSGVCLLPAAAAALLGPASLRAVAVAGVAVLAIVLCFAEASSHFEEPGSAYLFARHRAGERIQIRPAASGFAYGFRRRLRLRRDKPP